MDGRETEENIKHVNLSEVRHNVWPGSKVRSSLVSHRTGSIFELFSHIESVQLVTQTQIQRPCTYTWHLTHSMKTAEGQQWFFWRVQGSCGLIFRRRDRVSAKGGLPRDSWPLSTICSRSGSSLKVDTEIGVGSTIWYATNDWDPHQCWMWGGEPERARAGEGNGTPETHWDERMLCTAGKDTWIVIHTRSFVTLPLAVLDI